MDDRQAMTAILYVLRTGIQWNALPRDLGAASTVHDRFQYWEREGVFRNLWEAGLQAYDEVQGIEWTWQAMDGAMTKAPLGGKGTGRNPTDRERNRSRARRWVVQRTHSWLNRFRRILVRWEKKIDNYLVMFRLACAWITFRTAKVFE